MITLYVTDGAGERHTLNLSENCGLMVVLRSNNLGVEAICGGCCSCGTCHVYIDATWTVKLPAPSDEETEVLVAGSFYRPLESRLACQLNVTDELNGIEITVAPPD